MKRSRNGDRSRVVGLLLAGTALAGAVCLAAESFEAPPSLKASELLPASLRKGPRHEVAEGVKGDGFLTAFTVESSFGRWEAADREMLEIRVGEVYALERLSEVMKAAGVGDAARLALLVNGNFTPTLQTELVEAVAALGSATGKTEVVSLAAESKTEGDARYIRRCVQQLANGVKDVGGWKALTTSQNEIEAVASDGRLVFPWSVDYMTWNADTVPADTPPVKAAKTREVWIAGEATARAKQELQASGFAMIEKRP